MSPGSWPNIVKIIDKNNRFKGTGFLLFDNFVITCHHCIFDVDEIYIESDDSKYPAKWYSYYSTMEKDIAVLQIEGLTASPLEYTRETLPGIDVYIRGYTAKNLKHFPDGELFESKLYSQSQAFEWPEGRFTGNKQWNIKPLVSFDVFRLAGKFDLGLSGSPVFFPINDKVVGMFTAKEEDYGYVIPIETILQKFLNIVPNIPKEISLFLSKPSNKNLNSDQAIMLDKLKEILKSNGIGINFLEPKYYSKDKPIQKVRNVLKRCHGVIIIGFKQIHISSGVAKKGSDSQSRLRDISLPTPWNNIEAALAFANDIPILVISEEGVTGGIFDRDMTEFPMYWLRLPSNDWWLSTKFVQLLKKWFDEVIVYQSRTTT